MEDAITLIDITKKYGTTIALDKLSLSILQGDIYGLLGPNGAGKTTTLRICTTLLKSDSGKLFFSNKEFNKVNSNIRQSISLMPQGKALDPLLNVEDNLRYYGKLIGLTTIASNESIDKLINIFGLAKFRKKNVFALSGGQFRRAQLARTFLGKPKFILLDEPTLGIDIQGKINIWTSIKKYVKENECTILLASNDMTEIENTCNVVGFISSGKLLFSSKMSNLSTDNNIHLKCKLKQSYSNQHINFTDNISLTTSGNFEVNLHFNEYNNDVFSCLNELSMNFGIVNLFEEKMSLTDLFEKYGDVK